MRPQCPNCDRLLVPPQGPEDAAIILVGSVPSKDEIMSGIVWSGDAGQAFKQELGRAGFNYRDCRVANLWQHAEVPKKDDSYVKEMDWHFGQLMKEFAGRQAMFLMGRQVVDRLLDRPISDLEGLSVSSEYFPPSLNICIVSRHPSIMLTPGGVVGNTRHSIERFAQMTREIRL